MSEAGKRVRIGCASGFWGDSPAGARQLVERGEIRYLVFDYLAEITLALLARMRAKRPETGYVPDFVSVIDALLPELMRRGIRVVSNGGGMNPAAAAAELEKRAAARGLSPKIAVVTGDDILLRAHALRDQGVREMFTGEALPSELVSASAYLGARGIALALDKGAHIVVTGRCVDSAVTLGPLVHEFGWSWDDFDRLSAGSLAGHLLECGAQGTGGLFTDWREVPGWDDMGFPIADCAADGSFTIEKPAGTGGLITRLSVGEQMLYEIGDPAAYLLPDVACDWREVRMDQVGSNVLRVTGARGRAPTGQLKVSATVPEGFRTIGTVTIGGREAAAKAQRVGEAVLSRARRLMKEAGHADFAESSIEVLGSEATYGPHARPEARETREVVLKIGARHGSEAALAILTREIAPAATAMAQGLTGFFAGRPTVQPVLRSFSFLVPASEVPSEVRVGDEVVAVPTAAGGLSRAAPPGAEPGLREHQAPAVMDSGLRPAAGPGKTTVALIALAVGRSGDKGNLANIGVIAREPAFLPFIEAALTPQAVKQHFAHTGVTRVERFALPGIHALNFVLHDCLGGGGVASLRIDPQGKAFAQMLMDIEIPVSAEIAGLVGGKA